MCSIFANTYNFYYFQELKVIHKSGLHKTSLIKYKFLVYVNSLYYKWWTKTNFFLIHYNLEHLSLILTFHSLWTTVTSLYSTSLKITYLRKKQGASTLHNSMDGTGEHYAKWNKPGSERQIPYDLTYKGNLINKTSKQNTTRDIEIKNKLTVTTEEGGEG